MTPETKTGKRLTDYASEDAHAFLVRYGMSANARNDLTVLLSTFYLMGANDALRDETERLRESQKDTVKREHVACDWERPCGLASCSRCRRRAEFKAHKKGEV